MAKLELKPSEKEYHLHDDKEQYEFQIVLSYDREWGTWESRFGTRAGWEPDETESLKKLHASLKKATELLGEYLDGVKEKKD